MLTLFDFHWLTKFARNINLSNMVWAVFELECPILIFVYCNVKFKVTCKSLDLKMPVHRNPYRKNRNSNITVCLFFLKILCPHCQTIRCASKWFKECIKYLQFVNLKWVILNAQHIPFSLEAQNKWVYYSTPDASKNHSAKKYKGFDVLEWNDLSQTYRL